MPTALGGSSLGVGPFGWGTVPSGGPQTGSVYLDANGRQMGCPEISLDPATKGQYVYNEFGRRAGQGSARHLVILALATVRGSSCVPDLGGRFFELGKVTEGAGEEIKQRINEALSSLVARGVIQINSIEPNPGNGAPSVTLVRLTDLLTQKPIDIAV